MKVNECWWLSGNWTSPHARLWHDWLRWLMMDTAPLGHLPRRTLRDMYQRFKCAFEALSDRQKAILRTVHRMDEHVEMYSFPGSRSWAETGRIVGRLHDPSTPVSGGQVAKTHAKAFHKLLWILRADVSFLGRLEYAQIVAHALLGEDRMKNDRGDWVGLWRLKIRRERVGTRLRQCLDGNVTWAEWLWEHPPT